MPGTVLEKKRMRQHDPRAEGKPKVEAWLAQDMGQAQWQASRAQSWSWQLTLRPGRWEGGS